MTRLLFSYFFFINLVSGDVLWLSPEAVEKYDTTDRPKEGIFRGFQFDHTGYYLLWQPYRKNYVWEEGKPYLKFQLGEWISVSDRLELRSEFDEKMQEIEAYLTSGGDRPEISAFLKISFETLFKWKNFNIRPDLDDPFLEEMEQVLKNLIRGFYKIENEERPLDKAFHYDIERTFESFFNFNESLLAARHFTTFKANDIDKNFYVYDPRLLYLDSLQWLIENYDAKTIGAMNLYQLTRNLMSTCREIFVQTDKNDPKYSRKHKTRDRLIIKRLPRLLKKLGDEFEISLEAMAWYTTDFHSFSNLPFAWGVRDIAFKTLVKVGNAKSLELLTGTVDYFVDFIFVYENSLDPLEIKLLKNLNKNPDSRYILEEKRKEILSYFGDEEPFGPSVHRLKALNLILGD